jgi:Zn-dependent metalloprotease
MKKPNFTILFLLAFNFSFSQAKFEPKEISGSEAEAIWHGAEHVWLKQENTVPAFIEFRNGSEPDEATFFFIMRKTFQLPSNYSFKLLNDERDGIGWQHKRFKVLLNNVPVNNAVFLLHLFNGKVKKYNGYLFKNISASTNAAVSEPAALTKALASIGAQQYKWQLAEEENLLKLEMGNAGATYFPKGELEIIQIGGVKSNVFTLAWKFDIYAHQPMSRNYVYIDAQTGALVKKDNRIQEVNTTGTATTVYRGNRSITTDSYNGQYRLSEVPRGLGIHTYNMQKGTNYGGSVEFLDANNVWNNVNANLDQYATDAHWGGEMTYDFYTSMGRNSIDNAGFALNLYMHYSNAYVNAFWDGTRMTFGDGNATYDPLVSLDITGHEISHGLTERTSGLDYQDESGALNESFSDIFGAAVEWYADSTLANWLIGEDIGAAFRSMSNPNAYGDPDTYTGTNWYTGTADNGGVHTNSSVQNHWYYRLAQGGSGTNDLGNAYNVTGIGRNKATRIAWRNDVFYLTNTADYADARFYAIQSANDLFGVCSAEAIATTKAWYAVGVGADFVYGADAQFTASPVSGCTAPFTVNFINTSTNTSNYTWQFGDGGTSTVLNPSYTYNALGVYTVKLVANGGACGVDSLVRTNYINISNSNPCVVIMPVTGTYQTQTACTGTIYDNGGSAANYSDNTNSTVTIAPAGASQVRLHFTQFNMESGYDYLYVYDGPSTASAVIGSYTGTTLPADIVSTGSSVTIRQYSDVGVTAAGFAISWTCISANAPPVSNFKADATQSCTGAIQFTDLSTGGPNAWLWNFGDGATSTLQHPFHNYVSNGTYTVSLKASNAYGNNTNVKTSYVTITKPTGPSVANVSSCGPSSFNLAVAGETQVTWFDTSGNVVSNGGSFVTPVLSSTTTYYVQDTIPQPIYKVGPVSNAIGAGANYNTTGRALVFRVNKKSKLVSVLVYATGDGYRTVQYRDSLGGVIASRTVFMANGTSRVNLNIDLLPGGPYELGLRDTLNLYRNSAGAVYPYNDSNGIVSITGNNANAAGYYYFFYDWEVREKDCISQRTPVVATIRPALNSTSVSSNVSCNGGANGSVGIVLSAGTPGYTYSWSNNATTASVSNLPAGVYSVTATDAVGCSATATKTVTQPAAIIPAINVTNVLCNGANTGSLILNVSGGSPAYTYNWAGGATTQNRSNLVAGTYAITITDANNCTAGSSATISQPVALTINPVVSNASCGQNNGSVAANVSGGVPGYSYSWSNNVTVPTLSNVGAGTYSVTISDNNNCSATSGVIVNSTGALAANISGANATCFGTPTGNAVVNVTSGTQPFTYSWSNGSVTAGSGNVSAGSYNVTVTDATGCTATLTQFISEPAALNIAVTTIGTTCGQANGSVSASVNGGTQTYQYMWSNNASTPSVSGLAAAAYNLTVTDANNCTASASASVASSTALLASATGTNVTCHGGANGAVNVAMVNGNQPYLYSWSNSLATPSIGNLVAGSYTATVTDAQGCSATVTQTITEPAPINVSISAIDASCGNSNGRALTNVSGGTAGYSYSWSNNATDSLVSGLTAGNYSVTVNDANGCVATAAAYVNSTAGLSVSISKTDATCFGDATGSATASIANGVQPFAYNWSNGSVSSSITGIPAGNYTVAISDANGCSAIENILITEPAQVNAAVTTTAALCYGAQNGAAQVVVTGGTPVYNYQWCNGSTNVLAENLAAGNCELTVTDANGCSIVSSFIIQQPAAIQFATATTNSNAGANDGSVVVTAPTGGVGPYSFAWTNGDTTQNLSGVGGGTYTISVTDNNGCLETASVLVQENPTAIINVDRDLDFSVSPNPAASEICITINKLSEQIQVFVTDLLGQQLFAGLLFSQKNYLDVSYLPAGAYQVELVLGGHKAVKKLIVAR